jgi:hypothetical protein
LISVKLTGWDYASSTGELVPDHSQNLMSPNYFKQRVGHKDYDKVTSTLNDLLERRGPGAGAPFLTFENVLIVHTFVLVFTR